MDCRSLLLFLMGGLTGCVAILGYDAAGQVQRALASPDPEARALLLSKIDASPVESLHLAFLGAIAPPGLLEPRERVNSDFARAGNCDPELLSRLIAAGARPTHRVAYYPIENRWRHSDDDNSHTSNPYRMLPVVPSDIAPGIRLDHAAVAWCSPSRLEELRAFDWFREAEQSIVYARTAAEAQAAGEDFWRVMTPTNTMELQLMVGLNTTQWNALPNIYDPYCESERQMVMIREAYRAPAMTPAELSALQLHQRLRAEGWAKADSKYQERMAERAADKAARRAQFAQTMGTIAQVAGEFAPAFAQELQAAGVDSVTVDIAAQMSNMDPRYYTGLSSDPVPAPAASGSAPSAGPTQFTCSQPGVCVHYTVPDPDEARQMSASAGCTAGHQCKTAGAATCSFSDSGKRSTVYTYEPPENHDQLCADKGGS